MVDSHISPGHRIRLMALVVTALAVAGCGSSEPTETTALTTTPTSTILPEATLAPTTLAPQTTSASTGIIEVTFDGSVCTSEAADLVPADVHSFVLKDLTGEGLADVRTMAISDGHTYEDLLDLQSEPGEYVPLPEWAEWPLTTFESVDRELADNEVGKRLILEPGIHGIVVGTGKGLWFCGPLTVTES